MRAQDPALLKQQRQAIEEAIATAEAVRSPLGSLFLFFLCVSLRSGFFLSFFVALLCLSSLLLDLSIVLARGSLSVSLFLAPFFFPALIHPFLPCSWLSLSLRCSRGVAFFPSLGSLCLSNLLLVFCIFVPHGLASFVSIISLFLSVSRLLSLPNFLKCFFFLPLSPFTRCIFFFVQKKFHVNCLLRIVSVVIFFLTNVRPSSSDPCLLVLFCSSPLLCISTTPPLLLHPNRL